MPVAVITGASRGLGRALAYELAGRGWQLVLNARSRHVLDRTVEELREVAGPDARIQAVAGDVSVDWTRGALVAAAQDYGGLDLLVNNASALGAEPLVPLAEQPLDGLRAALETNVVAPLALVQEALVLLAAAPRGRVLNISSDAAVEAYETWGGYGASKAALDHLSAVLAVEQPALRVWAVDPGDMRTDLYAAAVPDDEDFAERLDPAVVAPALLRLVDEDVPSGRYTAAALAQKAVSA
ncbi:SDR family NAD(P)-dependent oxidoreductase [Streptomyces sp. NPDC051940]|uniref:SDR family NAD(P)-dependent oxidoreductase n=1 Tax=Streptomyces sp. NPDC051940 TaxID=3155675 RepID=UPI00343BB017